METEYPVGSRRNRPTDDRAIQHRETLDRLLRDVGERAEQLCRDPEFRRAASAPSERLALAQVEAGFMKLPVVIKDIVETPRGALYYVNNKGNRVYLKKYQKQQCRGRKLKGARYTCPK